MWCKKWCGYVVALLAAAALFGSAIAWNDSGSDELVNDPELLRVFTPDELRTLSVEEVKALYNERLTALLADPKADAEKAAAAEVADAAEFEAPTGEALLTPAPISDLSQDPAGPQGPVSLSADGRTTPAGAYQPIAQGAEHHTAAPQNREQGPVAEPVKPVMPPISLSKAREQAERQLVEAGYKGKDFGQGDPTKSENFRLFVRKLVADGKADQVERAFRDWDNVKNGRLLGSTASLSASGATPPAPKQEPKAPVHNGRPGGFINYGGGDCNTNGINDLDEFSMFEDYVDTPNLNFPDNVETTDTLEVTAGSGSVTMEDLNVDLVVTHIFMGDTEYSLDNPGGTNISLMDHVGGGTDNCNILFDDQAAGGPGGTMIGTFTPAQPLSTFAIDGVSRDGNWTIHCLDTFNGSGTGVLNQWSLHFRTFGDPDCNSNGVLDACDIAGGTSDDCNNNEIPDECEEGEDCNTNGVIDECDTVTGSSLDCNTNLVPDECEIGDCGAPGPDWDNGGVDGTDGLANQIGGVAPAQVADNYIGGAADTSIDIMTFSDVEDTTYAWDGTVQVATYENNGGGTPLEAAFDLEILSGGDIGRVQNGTVFGRPRWDYTLDTDVAAPGSGTHWVSATPSSGGASGQAFWLTSAVPSNVPSSYFRSTFFGFPTWTPMTTVYGLDLDFAFTLTFGGCGDCNSNGQLDVCDIADGSSLDCNNDEVPDECQDCNQNGKADECDITGGTSTDCNTNDILDECELAAGSALDCNTNELPDACDSDCNTNGLVDECEVADGLANDCNTNQLPDACDGDCNTNGFADICDIQSGTAIDDCNTNGIPDECEGATVPPGPDWDNGAPDNVDGLANQVGGVAPAQVSDNFTAGGGATEIDIATFSDVEDTTYAYNGTVQAATYGDAGGFPNEVETELEIVAPVGRVQNGTVFGRPRWDYTLDVDLDIPNAGNNWVSLTPRSDGASGQAFWLTSHVPSTNPTSYFRSSFFGFPTWTPMSTVYGQDLDFAFTLTFGGGDCNTNGQLDVCDIFEGSSVDCNTNETPDECELADLDCNTNNVVDVCDIFEGSSGDCDTDELPDECEDCNTNGLSDDCDLVDMPVGTSEDYDAFPGTVILDNSTVTTPPISVGTSGAVEDLNVDLDVQHTWTGDVVARVIHGATTVTLVQNRGGSGDNFTGTLFDDEATTAVSSGVPPFSGTFRPEQLLSAYDGQDRNGDWTLSVQDTAGGDTGTVLHWSLHFGSFQSNSEDCNENGNPDECDIASGSSEDCDTDGVPDECEEDCNANDQNDDCDLAGGTSNDCNTNGIPDECDNDCNTNGLADECDLEACLPDCDCNTNGILDACDLGFTVGGEDSPNTPIQDGVNNFTPPIVVGTGGDVADVDICFDATHTFDADVELSLIHNGTTVLFVGDVGGAGDNFTDTCLDDEASTGIGSGTPPFTGTFKPTQALSAFDGLDAAGNWVVRVFDDAGADTGTLLNWELTITILNSEDCNTNEIPDECEPGALPDCNTDGSFDICQVQDGRVEDCNTNEVPDECDATFSTSDDCNTNLIPDECEIGDCSAPGADWDNGVPDLINGGANQIGGVAPAEMADDFDSGGGPTTIEIMTFSDVEDTTYSWDGNVRVSSWADNGGGAPSEAANDTRLVPTDGGSIARVQNGTVFGRPRWDYTIETDVAVPGGVSWVSATPSSGGATGQAFWLTSHVPAVFGQSYFRSAFFGFPTWVTSNTVFGANWDVAFTLSFGGCKDCNSNGQLDVCDIADGSSDDCNLNDIPDECEPDCNANGITDECDILGGTSTDCNDTEVPDECEIAAGTSVDCDGDGLPDECEPDCNQNGVADDCDIANGTSDDCQPNGVPDECELGECGPAPHWDNGLFNGVNGQANQDGGVVPSEIADDYDPGNGSKIVAATFTDVEDTTYAWNGEVRVSTYMNNGAGKPSEAAFDTEIVSLSLSSVSRIQNGTLFSRPKFDYTLSPADLSVPGNQVGWFSAVPRSNGTTGQAFLLTSHTPETFGNSFIRSTGFGFPTWTESTLNSDFAFTLTFQCNDCNTNGIPDDCDAVNEGDCNTNQVPDVCDLLTEDCDTDGVVDACEEGYEDCNTNGVADECDIAFEDSDDCQTNGIPDECEGEAGDCNTNGVTDICDILDGVSEDCNTNGQPDECEVGEPFKSFEASPGTVILDNVTVLSPPIAVSPGGPIADVNVEMDIRHTFDADLDIFVVHGGLTVELATDVGGSGDNFTGTVLDEDVANSISSGTAPFTGTFNPEGNLDAFVGTDKAGDWALQIGDDAGGDTGTLLHWALFITNDFEDCNTNGEVDSCEVASGDAADCDTNGVVDECQSDDCNDNDVPDSCDVVGGTSNDCNGNGVPDECETNDCNTNSIPDDCEDNDCNTNGVLDECEVADGFAGKSADQPTDLVLPDGDPVFSDLVVADTGALSDLNVKVDIRHTFDADLDVFLIHVDTATTVEMFTDVGGSGDNFTGTLLDEDVANSISSGTAPFTGTFNPEGNFNLFDGQDKAGTWRMSIDDDAGGDTGTLLNWTLFFTNPVFDCNTNDVPDECDIASGNSEDADGDGIPDECFPACTSCTGDLTGDGNVDGDDVQGFIDCLFAFPPAGVGCGCADMDGDQDIDADDLTAFVTKLLTDPTPCP